MRQRTVETQNVTEEILASLPTFVRAHLLEQVADRCGYDGDEDEWAEREQELLADMQYAVLTGSIDMPYHNTNKLVSFWTGTHDNVQLHIHIGGSACWIHPDNDALYFEAIPKDLVPSGVEADQSVWWVIDRVAGLYKIRIRPESEFVDDFPDELFVG